MPDKKLELICPPGSEPLDPDALDAYLRNIPTTEVFNTPKQLIQAPANIPERLAAVMQAARAIEVQRDAIAYHGSVLRSVFDSSPETIQALPYDQQQTVLELISRMRPEADNLDH